MEPEVVATSPNRGKSPVPVYCGFDSVKLIPNLPCSIPIPNRDCITLMLAGQNGARGRTCTCTGDALDVVPLRWATRAK